MRHLVASGVAPARSFDHQRTLGIVQPTLKRLSRRRVTGGSIIVYTSNTSPLPTVRQIDRLTTSRVSANSRV
jgi:hypothetical protein